MAKKCINCGFLNNPDDGHYCGKCGANIASYSHVWKVYDSSDYSTYYKYGNRVISDSAYKEYKGYEQAVKNSYSNKLKTLWKKYEDKIIPWSYVIFVVALVLGGLLINRCSSSEKKLARFEVDGKYGIGYDKDNLLVPAIYDSIEENNYGNQWIIYNPKEDLKGLAYVTDKVQNIIEPQYTKVEIGSDHYSLLRKSELEKDLISYYEYVAYDGKIKNEVPFNALSCVPSLSNPGVFRERNDKSMHQLYSLDLEKIGPEFYRLVECTEDSLFVGENSSECLLYDFKGNRLNTSPIYRSEIFSDGVAWAYLTKSDYINNRLSLIDKTGKAKFQVTTKPYSSPGAFSNGVGRYENTKGQWVNVDKEGNELSPNAYKR